MTKETAKVPYRADNVAKYLIFLSSKAVVGDNNEREGITNLKLQKILYFAQAYYLAKLGKPLFKESIEAWNYGPVVPEIYHKYKRYKNNAIISTKDNSTLTDEDKQNLNKIWESFGAYSASRLVDIVHSHTPWQEANGSGNKVISNKSIKEYYEPLLTK